ncbi:MAG: nucleoside triphosphate pyrophosphohydrolase [Bacillota bacterium]
MNQRAGAEIDRLMDIMRRLRGADGCPWDRKQDHQSLAPYLLEETYEVLEAIDERDPEKLCEELGDLLLQIVFHARIAEENGFFSMSDVEARISDKLERRHPHVFGEVKVNGVSDVLRNWDQIKSAEKFRESLLDGVPKALPALQYAEKIQQKAAKVGFQWSDIRGAWDKMKEEMDELKASLKAEDADQEAVAEEVGDLLFAVVNVARYLHVHPEQALRKTSAKFEKRFRFMEDGAAGSGKRMSDLSLEEMDELWNEAKKSQ